MLLPWLHGKTINTELIFDMFGRKALEMSFPLFLIYLGKFIADGEITVKFYKDVYEFPFLKM